MIDPRMYTFDRNYRCMRRFETVPPDPAKAYRCTVTVATSGQHECRVNRVTGDVYDRCDGELYYVGRSCGDGRDVEAWMRLVTTHTRDVEAWMRLVTTHTRVADDVR